MSPLPATVPALVRSRVRAAVRRPARLTVEELRDRALLLRLCSLLLQYPDAELAAARPALGAAVAGLPPSPAAAHLADFTAWFTGREAQALERHYVETFDLRRRSSLYLTYYLHGDTRRRGMALLALARSYRAAGWDTTGGELPDHLPVVLEFAALGGPRAGEAPLRRHRRGLELIHRALTDDGSPYRHVTAALLTLLPPPTEADLRAVAELAAQGPPGEDVGLDPYDGAGAGGSAAPDAWAPPGACAPPGAFVPPGAFAPPGALVPPERARPTLAPPPLPSTPPTAPAPAPAPPLSPPRPAPSRPEGSR
ncbi:nitrate reductase molybdenum cofactor assembly chaperone [Streptomyces rubrolavendulae]|uniref:Nitrate reductase-like protein NarX n=1 Tax=Streptomyces rubrolavendulae TaxID=285473 RepID=A0A1D8G8X8_9ACTN|nr:nitrate reductase molybdenum cofactor assembly chaperone [Streptomyces rubrolavendulae]AOT61906.1 Nitrate reductase-like protein NarX [Streptomyces rubrolavendulae]